MLIFLAQQEVALCLRSSIGLNIMYHAHLLENFVLDLAPVCCAVFSVQCWRHCQVTYQLPLYHRIISLSTGRMLVSDDDVL